jgi:hypothetical protein
MFFKVIHRDVSLEDFEKQVYENTDLEVCLAADQYLGLVEFNYKESRARYELFKLVERIVDMDEYHIWRFHGLLNKALAKADQFALVMMEFYDLYCDGYYFLKNLGLGYGLMFSVTVTKYEATTWNELSHDQQVEMIDELYPKIEKEIIKINSWMDEGKRFWE